MLLNFGHFSVNTDTYELLSNNKICPVEPLVFNLIAYFATHPSQILSREELIETVWKGRIVSDTTIATAVKHARKALGDKGNRQTYIQTVRGRGYRFVAEVSTTGAVMPAASPLSRPADINTDPSLLILPFRCLSDKPEVGLIADGLALELGTILTRIPLLRLSAQGSRYQSLQNLPTVQQIHEDLGVDFVLDGHLQNPGARLRANIQLSDARTGYRLWAESFESSEALNDALDHLVTAIIGKLEPQLHRAMYQLVRKNDTEPSARQLFLEASGLLVMQGWHHDSFVQAAPILRRSAQLDPDFALAPSLLSLVMGFGTRIGLLTDLDKAKAEALQTAEQALKLDGMDSTVLGLSGCALADIGYLDRGESLLRSAIDLNPANAQAWVALGAVHIAQNQMDDAVAKLSKGIEISPLDSRLSVWGALLAMALLVSGDLEGACAAAETACRRNDRTYLPRLALAGIKLMQKDMPAALGALANARRIKADLSVQQIRAIIGRDLCNNLLALEKAASTH